MERHVLIADPSPFTRNWLRRALANVADVIIEVSDGVELLEHVAESGPFDLVVAHRELPMINADQVLASVRTAGDHTPWLVLAPFCRDSIRSRLIRLGGIALLDDPLDARALLQLSRSLLADQDLAA